MIWDLNKFKQIKCSEMFCIKCVSACRLTFMSEWKLNINTYIMLY